MSNMRYLIIFLYLQISWNECTINIKLSDFVYLADHMTTEECHRLFASLHFITYELPDTLYTAVKKIPKGVPCIKLLLKWNSGQEKWEGMRKTHMEVEHRLRQIGRYDLAEWLGNAAFHNVARDLNDSLTSIQYFEQNTTISHPKLVTDKENKYDNDEWTPFDSILWVILLGLTAVILIIFCRFIIFAYKRAKGNKSSEELIDLLSMASAESDVEETIYEYKVEGKIDKTQK